MIIHPTSRRKIPPVAAEKFAINRLLKRNVIFNVDQITCLGIDKDLYAWYNSRIASEEEAAGMMTMISDRIGSFLAVYQRSTRAPQKLD